MTRVLITGGAGFSGHHFIEHYLDITDWDIIVFDKLTYASSGFERLREIGVLSNLRVKCFAVDFNEKISPGIRQEIGEIDIIIHMGAETHVDNSITDPLSFIKTNVIGTYNMLEYARSLENLSMFIYFSTDEVFGPAPEGMSYKPWDRYNSGNPYAATKAAGEELCLAYANTYGVNVLITHTMNMFGERQHEEKFIPLIIKNILLDKKIYIHADHTKTKPGSRFYIHARNVASALHYLIGIMFLKYYDENMRRMYSKIAKKFNISGLVEVDNLKLVETISSILNKDVEYELIDHHSSRPGHDLRYALDGSELVNSGWKQPVDFMESLEKTVNWYLSNRKWLGM